jgi:hypothetical protein
MRRNSQIEISNDLNFELAKNLKGSLRKTEYEPKRVVSNTRETMIKLEKSNVNPNMFIKNNNNTILTELDEINKRRDTYEQILKNKKNNNVNVNKDMGNNAEGENVQQHGFQNSLFELINSANTTNSILTNVSNSLGFSQQKNPNNISNVNSGHKDFVFEFDSKYRNRNLPSNLDPNKYFSFSLSNVKTSDNIYLGNIGVGYPLENVIEMEMNELTIPNILANYDETKSKKKINLQIVELIDKNVIETSSISEWKDKHFIFEINQYVEYNANNQLVINDNYLKLIPVINKIRFPAPVVKLDKLTFIFSLEDTPLEFANDLIIGDLTLGPLNRTNVSTSIPHNLTTNDILVISDNRTGKDLIDLYPELVISDNIIDPNLNNNLVLNNRFPLEQEYIPDSASEYANSDESIVSFYHNRSNKIINKPNHSTVFKINGIADYANVMLYHFNNITTNSVNLYYKMMKNNIADYFKMVLNSINEYKVSNVVNDYNFNFLINSYSYFEFIDNNDLKYMATLKNIENIIAIIDKLNDLNKYIYKNIDQTSASLSEDEYVLARNNLSLFNINKELYSYNDNQVITIEVTVVSQLVNNILTYNYYFDGILVSEYILYNNNTYIFDQSDNTNLNYTLKFSTTKPTDVGEGQVGYTLYNYSQNGEVNPVYKGIAGTVNGGTTLVLNSGLVAPGTVLYCFSNNLPYNGMEIKLTIAEPILPSYINILKEDLVDTYVSSPLPPEVQNAFPDETNNNSTLTYSDYINNIYYLEKYINNQDKNAIDAATNSLALAQQNTNSATTTLSNYQQLWGLVSNLYNSTAMNIKLLNAKKLELYLLKFQISYLMLENSSISEDNEVIMYVTVKNNKYYINGNDISSLNLYYGNTYIFDLSDSSNLGNGAGFIFSLSKDSVAYNTNVVYYGTLGTEGSYVKINVVLGTTPETLYYGSSLLNNMGDLLIIKKTAITELTNNISDLSLSNSEYKDMWNGINLDSVDNKFKISVENNSFYINNIKSSTFILNLIRGNTYIFDLTDNSLNINNANFVLCNTIDGSIYNTNVSISNNLLSINIDNNTPSVLYYKNTNTLNYGGMIKIYNNDAFNVASQIGKKNMLSLFKNYYSNTLTNLTNLLKKRELLLNTDKEILEKSKEYNKIKSIIINNYKANDGNFNINVYNPTNDINNIKGYISNLQNNLPNELSSYSTIMANYEKTKNDIQILLEDLGMRKYNIMEKNNSFIWSESNNGINKNIVSSLRVGVYTIYELMKEIENILNKDSPFGYLYKVNIDYNNLSNVNNMLNRCYIECIIPDNNNNTNGFQIRYDLENLYDLLFSTFNISFQNAPSTDYNFYKNILTPLTNGNVINMDKAIVKKPIQLGDSRKIFTVYVEENSTSGQDIIGVLREYDPADNDYNLISRIKLGSIGNNNNREIYLCNLFYDNTTDNNIYYNLVCVENKIYLVSINLSNNNINLVEELTNIYIFSNNSIDKFYEPILIRDKNVNNNKKVVIFYDISAKKFKSLIVDLTLSVNRVYLGNDLLITNYLSNTTNVGSNPLTVQDLSTANIIEVSGVLKLDDYQHIWALTILENNTTYSTIMCNINFNNNNIECNVSSYIENYSGVNDTTAFFVYNNNTFVWVGKNYYIRNVNNVFSNKMIKLYVLTLTSNQIILNNENSNLFEVAEGDSFVLDVIVGRKLENTNKFYLIQSNYYYNSVNDYSKKITLKLYNMDSINYEVILEKSFVIEDTNASSSSIYYYMFGMNNAYNNAYYYPQTLYYFPDYNIHNWYYVNNYMNNTYKNYLSFVMIDNLITNEDSSKFTLNKNYLGELETYNVASVLGTSYISTNNIFDLLYNTDVNYNKFSNDLKDYYQILEKLRTFNDSINYYNERLKVLNEYINLKDYMDNYTRNNNVSYSAIESLVIDINNYYDDINNNSKKLFMITSSLEILDVYTKNINDNLVLINNWDDEIYKYNLKLNTNRNTLNLKNLELNTSNAYLNSSNNDITIDNLINYYKNYINGGKDDNNTDFSGYLQQLRTLNGQINTYMNYLNPSTSSQSSLLSSFMAALNQAQATYNTHNSLLTEYKTNLNLLLNKIYNSSTNMDYKNAASLYLTNYANYTKSLENKTQILSIINNLKGRITLSKNQIAADNYNLAKNKLDLVNNNKFLIDLNFEVFTKVLIRWLKSGGNDNMFNRIFIQNITIPEVPFYISNRRFQITLRLRVLSDSVTQGILNV